jgi:hypothetical protein
MLKVKSLVVLVVFAILFSFIGTTFAKDYPGDRAGRKADYLYKKLSLTTDQYTKIYQSYFAYETKIDDLQKAKKDKGAYKDELMKLQNSANGDVEKILNKDQVAKFTGMKDKMFKMSYKKKVRKTKTETTEGTEKKTDKKDMKNDVKKETKKDEKKDVKKDEKKDVKKDEKKDVKKDTKKDDKK